MATGWEASCKGWSLLSTVLSTCMPSIASAAVEAANRLRRFSTFF